METSSADTKDPNGKATRGSGKRREYPPATELLQTQCETPKKPPILPFTIDQGGRPIKDEDRVDLAIALAKLDSTCLEILEFAAKAGVFYRRDRDTHGTNGVYEYSKSTGMRYTTFRTKQKTLEITDGGIVLRARDLLDINRSVSMVISQEYLSGTELSRYWELLPSAFVFLASSIDESIDSAVKSFPLPVEAGQVRQKALMLAQRGALEHEIRTELRQRWTCMEKVMSHTKAELREDMRSLNLLVDLRQGSLLAC